MAVLNSRQHHVVLQKMFTEDYPNFYLTGSRFFGEVNEQSDWDFFTEDSQDTQTWLRANDFTVITKGDMVDRRELEHYADKTCLCLYEHRQAKIHVQIIRRDYMSIKHMVQEYLFESNKLVAKDKIERQKLWQQYIVFGIHCLKSGVMMPNT